MQCQAAATVVAVMKCQAVASAAALRLIVNTPVNSVNSVYSVHCTVHSVHFTVLDFGMDVLVSVCTLDTGQCDTRSKATKLKPMHVRARYT